VPLIAGSPNRGGKTPSLIASGSCSKLSNRAVAVLAISTMGCVTAVRAGPRCRAHNGSSKPTIERSRGTSICRSPSAVNAPRVISLLATNVPELGAQSESDINGQISILENAVSEKPAAIVISPPQEAVCLRKQHRRQPDGHRKTPFPLANIIETGTVE
jgi:hypothetical protein